MALNAQAGCSGEKARAGGWALLAGVVCLVAISRQSLWIDEALTAVKASQASLHAWWEAMLMDKASDLQMPLYMIYVWGFAKIFGVSEWALRLANLPWFVAGMAAFMGAVPGRKKLAAVALMSPFAWYYLDEARPYAMQVGASFVILAALRRVSEKEKLTGSQERFWVGVFFFAIISLSGSSLLGMIWAGAACLSLGVLFTRQRLGELARSNWVGCVGTALFMAALAGYYLWTLKVGARASDVGKTDVRNVVFIAYELLGFGGLGPGRLEIRDGGLAAFAPFAKLLALYAVAVGDLAILGGWRLRREQTAKVTWRLAAVIALPMGLILAAGLVAHFRVLGRHFTPVLPVAMVVLGLGLEARWSRRHWISRPLAVGYVMLSLVSCLSFRLAARHAKDDYRGAAMLANSALQGKERVWWNAGREGATYYQVPLDADANDKPKAVFLMNPTEEFLSRLPEPDVIIASKSDVYDGAGAVTAYVRQGRYVKRAVLPAFTIWERAGAFANARVIKNKHRI